MKKAGGVLAVLMMVACAALSSGCAKMDSSLLSGMVESSQYDVSAQTQGMVAKMLIKEGALVMEGDVIAQIDSAMQEATLSQAQAQVKVRQARLDEVKAGSRTEQITAAEAAVNAAQAKYEDLKKGATSDQIRQAQVAERLAASNEKSARIAWEYTLKKFDEAQDLFDGDRLTQSALDDYKLKLDTAKGVYDAAAYQHDSAAAQLAQVKQGATSEAKKAAVAVVEQMQAQLDLVSNGATSFTVTAAEADLEAAQAQEEQASIALSRCIVKAPATGVLTALGIRAGDMVNAGSNVATIIDPNDLWVRVYIPQAQLERVSLNQRIQLVAPAYPDKTFSGRVVFIASEAEFTPKNIQTDEDKANTVFRLKIVVDAADALKPGMTLNAVIAAK